jgi:SAM-dependent methyltransferase
VVKESTRNDWESYWGSKEKADDVYSNSDRIARNLDKVVSLRNLSVLEIGAGTGRDSIPLADRGATVYQLDYSHESLRLMKGASGDRNITQIGADTFRLPFRDNTFDIVFHQGLLEHFRPAEAERMVREQLRIVKPGGYLVVDVPQRYHPYTVMKHVLIFFDAWFAGWERSFSYVELKKMFTEAGVEPVYRYGEWMVPSLLYRVVREVFRKIGIALPLYPVSIPVLASVRQAVRRRLLATPLPLYSGVVFGIVGKKRNR